MKRREFVQKGGLSIAALSLPEWLLAAKIDNIGIQLYTLRDDMKKDAKATIKAVSKIGFTQVEGYNYNGKFWEMPAVEFKKYLDDLGLSMPSMHIGSGRTQNFGPSLAKDLEQVCDDAAKVGLKYIVCPWIPAAEYETEDALKQTIDFFNKSAEKIKSFGLQFAYHNHSFEFKEVAGKTVYDHLLDGTDKELVKFEMDLFWVYHGRKTPKEYFDKYLGRFHLYHIKDMDITNRDRNAEVGTGSIDFKNILALNELSGCKYFYYEQESYNYTPLESAKKSYGYLNKLKF